jgi:hypothetical protein
MRILCATCELRSRDSVVGIVTRIRAWFGSRQEHGGLLVSKLPSPTLGPLACCSLVTGVSSRRVERPRREVNQVDEVKSEWIYTFTSPLCLHGVGRENFVFHIFL